MDIAELCIFITTHDTYLQYISQLTTVVKSFRAFFIPYLIALFFIGIPLVILEISLGQYHQTGDVGVFGGIHKRLRGVGLGSVVCAWVVVTYYVPLIGWVVNAFFDSFRNAALWERGMTTGSEAYSYFLDEIVGEKTLGDDYK